MAVRRRQKRSSFSTRRRTKPSPVRLVADHEHLEQVAFFNYLSRLNHPAASLVFAIPNQAVALLTKAKGVWFWQEGCRAGVPDLFVSYPSGGYHGLYIEMKAPGEEPTDKQLEWHRRLRAAGYRVEVRYSGRDAFALLCEYLGVSVSFR